MEQAQRKFSVSKTRTYAQTLKSDSNSAVMLANRSGGPIAPIDY
jgi:hypothetical protein